MRKRSFNPMLRRLITRGSGLFSQPRADRMIIKGNRRWRLLSGVVVVVAIAGVLALVGVAPIVIAASAGVIVVILIGIYVVQRRKTEKIFAFYVAADQLLREPESGQYRFEVADAVRRGEEAVRSMPDPPPVGCFALGALYSLIGDHNAVVERLGIAAEEEILKQSTHATPSRKLRRYVSRLRQMEHAPKRYAKVLSAIRNLERMHQDRGARLLAESQQQLKRHVAAFDLEIAKESSTPSWRVPSFSTSALSSVTPPPPISEVLKDVYQEDQKT